MQKLALIALAAAAVFGSAGVASAQGVGIYVGPGYAQYYEPRPYYRERYYDPGYDRRRYDRPRYYGRYEGRRWNTWNGCPPRYTIQDGACKPYRGY
jgi:hypothetical protein